MPRPRGRSSGALAAARSLALGLTLLALTGCVERRYTIRTDPPGALILVNGEEVGISPVSADFTYYGDRRITAIAEGYQTFEYIQPFDPPIYDNLLTEFFTENLIPYTWRDEREFPLKLKPATAPLTEDLVGRAEQLRRSGQAPPPAEQPGIIRRLFPRR